LTLQATMSMTTASAGSGFYGGMIIGDPPAAAPVPDLHRFVEAAAGFGADVGGSVLATPQTLHDRQPLLAMPARGAIA
jgi:hypothetical protein